MDEYRQIDQRRFRDPKVRLHDLAAEDILVRCPRCAGRATSTPHPIGNDQVPDAWAARRLACPACGYSASWDGAERHGSVWGGPVDPYFRLPLWLTADFRGNRTLWAFHRTHLELLAGHIGARLRERGPGPDGLTLVARLPAWMKSAKHRGEVLRIIARLRATIDS